MSGYWFLTPGLNTLYCMNKTKLLQLTLLLCFSISSVFAADYEVISPDSKLKIKLQVDNGTAYEIWHGNTQLITLSSIGLNLSDGTIIGAGTVKATQTNNVNNQIDVLIGKNKTLTEAYNELIIEYNENYSLIVRAYNEGLAYRFVTYIEGEIIINSEDAIFNFASNTRVYFPECDTNISMERGDNNIQYPIHQGFRNFERTYNIYSLPVAIADNRFSVTPVLFEYTGTPYKVVITEADTYDYPGMYMESARPQQRTMRGMWAQYPKSVMDPDNYYSNHLVYEREEYIAKTDGRRTFPWRVIIPVDDDKLLLNNELVYMLAEPCRIEDTSWIQPGKTAWEWWHKAMLEDVPFPVGNNNLSIEMYKYYIDWASENGIEYMTFDAGYQESWLFELCRYAKDRNVKIIVWTWASCVREYPGDWVRRMKALGASGAKIDFFERNDQIAMRWGHEFAERLAANEMIGLYHGCPVPTGLNRTYPNILNFEAVRGAEDNFWRSIVTPDYRTLFPFIRQVAGPLDYTPGSMRNTTREDFFPVDVDNTVPMSMGTRAHELSMYVIFDQWLAYLCDSPTEYNKYPDILDFLSSVPAVWDQTLPLDAELGKYILMAKKKDAYWYVGGMSNWDERTINVDFDFLSPGISYEAFIIKDAPNSSNQPKEYISETITVTKDTKLSFYMAEGGGFVIRLKDPGYSNIPENVTNGLVSVYIDKPSQTLRINTDKPIVSAQVFDISGKQLLAGNYNNNQTSPSIDISKLKRGHYIVRLQTEQGFICVKFIN